LSHASRDFFGPFFTPRPNVLAFDKGLDFLSLELLPLLRDAVDSLFTEGDLRKSLCAGDSLCPAFTLSSESPSFELESEDAPGPPGPGGPGGGAGGPGGGPGGPGGGPGGPPGPAPGPPPGPPGPPPGGAGGAASGGAPPGHIALQKALA
jgi:hypothetical protein